ncbi:pav [Trypoxylus dichotomus]
MICSIYLRSGKTYTLTGNQNDPGIMPRCIDTLFNTIGPYQAKKFIIKSDKMNGFEVQSDIDAAEALNLENKMNIRSLKFEKRAGEVEVKSAAEAYDLFNIGQKRKRMGHTVLNAVSSRSHSIFSIRLVQVVQQLQNADGNLVIPECNMLKVSQLCLVDLAGSERCSRTKNTGIRLKEASNINNSLMTLRTCMEILRDNQLNNANRLVPYRDSRLTLLFKNYFEGEGCVHMVVCVNPASEDYEENLQVMKFAEISRNVKVNKGESRYTPCRKKIISKTITHTPSSSKVPPIIAPLIFGPQIPIVKLDLENIDACDAVLARLLKVLKARKENAVVFERELTTREQNFRKQLIEINQENVISKHEIRNMKMILKQEKYRTQNYETKVLNLETVNDNLSSKADELQSVIRNLKCTIDEKDLKINQNLLEKERIRQRQVIEKEKLSQEVDAHLRRQREELHAKMQMKDIKLQKVKEILEKEDITSAQVKAEDGTQTIMEANVPKTPTPFHTSHHRNIATSGSRRRSRSAGDVWLEHNVIIPTELGTVLQPSMKKRKSITKLSKASDILNPKQSKYCLISQEPDVDGVMETKLYKADIIQTCGGGAQVVFNDVEALRQESPTGSPKKS